ncbi:hypothetical protein GOV12_07495 [Candidatus Pacearchaeota archaeon]|nr:hypothetical protein [Candidatus Pacearchaeota archaeon]
MLGVCPNCKISLKDPPVENRNTNEVMLVLKYRGLVEQGIILKSIEDLGYCELCKATLESLKKQENIAF